MRGTVRGLRRGNALVIGAVLAAAVALAGCAGSSSSTPASTALKIGIVVPNSLDPSKAPEPSELVIATWPVYDRLIKIGLDLKYAPMLATSWSFSDDGRSLTLQLRKGVKFSDGTPFDAAAVKANLDWDKKAKTSALAANVANIAKVDVLSSDSVKVDLVKPSTTIVDTLASEFGGIMISPKALGRSDLGSHPVGTGAYVVTSFKPGQEVHYKRRTDSGGIWDSKTGKPDTVAVIGLSTADSKENAIKSGQVNVVTWPGGRQSYRSQLDSGQLRGTVLANTLNLTGINFNQSIKPYDDVKVRQAVNYAIDRKAITKAFTPLSSPRVQPWPDGLPGFDASRESAYPYDPAKAKQLLAQAGFPKGLDGGEMLVAQSPPFPQAAQVVQANLAAVGIKVQLRQVDDYALVTQWAKAKAPMDFFYMNIASINQHTWLDRIFVNPVWSPTADPQMARLAAGVDDPSLTSAQRAAKIGKAVDYATDNALYAPTWQGAGGYVASSDVHGVKEALGGYAGVGDFRDAYLGK